MSNSEHNLEQELAAMTRWEGESPELWREALKATASDEGRAQPVGRFGPRSRVAALVAAGVMVIIAASLLPSLRTARERSHDYAPLASAQESDGAARGRRVPPSTDLRGSLAERINTEGMLDGAPDGLGVSGYLPATSAQAADQETPADAAIGERHVARKATIELATRDVEGAFLRATRIPSAAHGEFVESSSLRGSGEDARAHLTLRVAANRLSDTLNELRELGEVRSEELQGEDVTGQVVDLDARLRNEQRVETELLQLLESRADAPLKDILEIRRQLNEVRQTIERLTARRESVRLLVDLATILVIIRPEDAPPEEPEAGLGRYFLDRMDLAWTAGLRFLTDTLAGGIRVLVGGLLVWILLAIAVVTWRHHRRQVAPNIAHT
jgi:hypothetical protein